MPNPTKAPWLNRQHTVQVRRYELAAELTCWALAIALRAWLVRSCGPEAPLKPRDPLAGMTAVQEPQIPSCDVTP